MVKNRKLKGTCTLIGPKDKGGLVLPDFEIVTKSVQCARSGKKTESIGNVGGPVIFDRDYDSSHLNLSKTKATCPNSAIFEHFQTEMAKKPRGRSCSGRGLSIISPKGYTLRKRCPVSKFILT